MTRNTTSCIGANVPRVDAYDKVTGRAQFTADLIPQNALTAKVLHATIANGLVKKIDCSKARSIPGVVKIVTCFEVPDIQFATPGNPWTLDKAWQDIADRRLLNRRVRYYGDDIAAVIAETQESADAALRAIEVEYDVYPPVFDPMEAMHAGGVPIHEEFPSNILGENQMEQGDWDAAVSEPDLKRVEGWYHVPAVKHCHIENPTCFAYEENRRLTIVSATQMPHVLRRIIGQALGLAWGDIRVVKPHIGGGFGNKDDALYEPLAAFLCRQVGGRCVRLELSREEDFVSTRTRHAMAFHLISYVRRDGTLAARSLESFSNSGAYASHGHAIASKGLLDFSMIYRSDAYRCRAYTVYTNMPCAGAMRGYGIPQVTFALESHADDIAAAIGMDPVTFRRKNMMAQGFRSDDGVLVNYFDSLNQCLDRAAAYIEAGKTPSDSPGTVRRGTGCAIFWYKTGVYPICLEAVSCRMVLNQDGSVLVHLAETEIGQGADTAFTQMAADRLGIPLENVHVVSQKDTDVTPFGTSAYASRQTYVCGMAIAETADILLEKIYRRAAAITGLPPETLRLQDGAIYAKGNNAPLLTLEQVAMESLYSMEAAEHLTAEHTTHCRSNALSLGCCMAEVEVDLQTGAVRVLQIVNAHDCGRLINPRLAQAQVHGGISMGLGYALTEQLQLDETTGRLRNGNLLDYKLLTAQDHPPRIGAVFVENPEPTSPFGTKALGEPPVVPVAPAIRNAIRNATGAAINTLPLTPQRCLAAFQAVGEEEPNVPI